MKHSLLLTMLFLFATAVDLSGMEKVHYQPPEDIEFTRCICDNSIYCLTDEQYTILMAQLSMRRGK